MWVWVWGGEVVWGGAGGEGGGGWCVGAVWGVVVDPPPPSHQTPHEKELSTTCLHTSLQNSFRLRSTPSSLPASFGLPLDQLWNIKEPDQIRNRMPKQIV